MTLVMDSADPSGSNVPYNVLMNLHYLRQQDDSRGVAQVKTISLGNTRTLNDIKQAAYLGSDLRELGRLRYDTKLIICSSFSCMLEFSPMVIFS